MRPGEGDAQSAILGWSSHRSGSQNYARMVQQMSSQSRHPDEMGPPVGNRGDDMDLVPVADFHPAVPRFDTGCSATKFAAQQHALKNLSDESSFSDEEIDLTVPVFRNVRRRTSSGGIWP